MDLETSLLSLCRDGYKNTRMIKKNSFESVLMRWMKLEPIIQSEVSQKDKDQYSILTYMEFRKMVMIPYMQN